MGLNADGDPMHGICFTESECTGSTFVYSPGFDTAACYGYESCSRSVFSNLSTGCSGKESCTESQFTSFQECEDCHHEWRCDGKESCSSMQYSSSGNEYYVYCQGESACLGMTKDSTWNAVGLNRAEMLIWKGIWNLVVVLRVVWISRLMQ